MFVKIVKLILSPNCCYCGKNLVFQQRNNALGIGGVAGQDGALREQLRECGGGEDTGLLH